jgi:hypothetical protein
MIERENGNASVEVEGVPTHTRIDAMARFQVIGRSYPSVDHTRQYLLVRRRVW